MIGAAFFEIERVITMDFISRKDVLKLFSVSVWTLRRWQKERQFPDAICASGHVRMYRKSEVEGWVEAQAKRPKLVNSQ
jgi:predicted DNA-binding transcriptional regulator AlpA